MWIGSQQVLSLLVLGFLRLFLELLAWLEADVIIGVGAQGYNLGDILFTCHCLWLGYKVHELDGDDAQKNVKLIRVKVMEIHGCFQA